MSIFPEQYYHGDPVRGRTQLASGQPGDSFGPLIYLTASAETASKYSGKTGSVYRITLDVSLAQAIDLDLPLNEQPDAIRTVIRDVAKDFVESMKSRILAKEKTWSLFSRPKRFTPDMLPYGLRQVALPLVDDVPRLLASNTWRVINGLAHAACEDEMGHMSEVDYLKLFKVLEERGIRMFYGHVPAEIHGGTCDNGVQYGTLSSAPIRSITELEHEELQSILKEEKSESRRLRQSNL